MDAAVLIEFLAATVRIATPLLFCALGGMISERAGIFAVGLEGMMLAGAFGGAIAVLTTASPLLGLASPPPVADCSPPSSRSRPRNSAPTRW